MKFELTVLGTSSATPTAFRHPSAQFLEANSRFYLIDCGEGTQMQLRRHRLRLQKISHIFISHLHGDHYFGLIGLLTSLSLLGRKDEIHVYSPPGLSELIHIQLKASDSRINYPLEFHELTHRKKDLIHEDKVMEVFSFPLKHRVPCYGFLFCEKKREPGFRKELQEEYSIPVESIPNIKKGEDFVCENGEVIPNRSLTTPPAPPRSFAYCSDTAFDADVIEAIRNADLLYHEATFTEEHEARARETYHSTAKQAAEVARQAGVSKLLIGHFSARYKTNNELLEEAKGVFDNTEAAEEGKSYRIPLRSI